MAHEDTSSLLSLLSSAQSAILLLQVNEKSRDKELEGLKAEGRAKDLAHTKELMDMRRRDEERAEEIREMRKDEAARGRELARLRKRDVEFDALKLWVEANLGKNQGSVTRGSEKEVDIEPISWILRLLAFGGGLVSLGMALSGFLDKDIRMAWTAGMFWPFSIICFILAGGANPKGIGECHEKIFVVICCMFGGGVPVLCGLTWIASENESTIEDFMWWTARGALIVGVILVVTLPPIFYFIILQGYELSNKDLNRSVHNGYKSSFRVCGSLLYLSTASLRCIWWEVEGEFSVEERCANPIGPSLCVMFLLLWAWAIAYILFPIDKGERALTWPDLLALRIPRTKAAIFLALGATSVVSLVLFSVTDENGKNLKPELLNLIIFWIGFVALLACILVFEYVLKPILNRNAMTHDDSASEEISPVRSSQSLRLGNLSLPGL